VEKALTVDLQCEETELEYRPESTLPDLHDRIALGEPVSAENLLRIERDLNLHHAKWDTHVGDGPVLSPQPMLIHKREWHWLSATAEAAARELLALEREIALDQDLQSLIGIPPNLRGRIQPDDYRSALRTLRFDFHPTTTRWVISEVNSDVPGGFGEASSLPCLYSRYTDAIMLPGPLPLKAWGDALQSQLSGRTAALLYAPGFLEDEQVVRILARELRERGFDNHLIQSPSELTWEHGCASFRSDPAVKIDLVVRFYRVEWLSQLPGWTGWKHIFRGKGPTRVINPAIAAISESKRLGLCFHHLSGRAATFRRLLPQCREPSEIRGLPKADWALKATYSNTGDEVHLGTDMTFRDWSRLLAKATRDPRRWVAQRRFETLSLPSMAGPVKPCVGVFVIAGRAAGAYVRLSRRQITDACALETPLFIMNPKEDQ